jgi:hypothetical protein
MAYRNKIYTAFDADSDIHYYRLMQAWKQNDNTNFDFNNAHDINTIRPWSSEDSIKAGLRERMKNSSVFILLVGEKTKFQNTYVRWEIELALKQGLPIIAVNLGGRRSMDESRCPLILRDKLAVHVSFNAAMIGYALEHWPLSHQTYTTQRLSGPYYYQESVYQNLGL